MRRDLHSNIKVVQHVAAQLITADNTPANGIDLKGFGSAEIVFSVGAVANIANSPQPTWEFKLQESDQAATGFTDVVNADDVLVGSAKSPVTTPDSSSGVFLTIDDAAEDAETYRIGYIGNKRYVRLVALASNTPGNTPYSAAAVLGRPGIAPTAD